MKYPHTTKLTVPFGDVDMMGNVNNARYLSYFEIVRSEHLLSLRAADPGRIGVILAHAEIDYKAPSKWRDELILKMRTISVGNSSWVYEYEITNDKTSTIVATGKTVQVAYDYTSGHSIPIPVEIKKRLLLEVEQSKE